MGTLTDLLRGHPAMNHVWSEAGTLQAMLDVEAALARSCAEHGVIPQDAVAPIVAACRADLFDIDALKNEASAGGNLAIPLVWQLTAKVKLADIRAAGFVHWGATSQDIIDTGLVLQLRSSLVILERQINRLASSLAARASEYRTTPTVGRTWLQQALPMTFGLKFAQYLDAVGRLQDDLARHQENVAVLQFGGAAGTLASLGEQASAVSRSLARHLGLNLPDIPWHTQRDRLVSVAAWMGMLTGACAKMARDMSLLAQTEIGEVAEASAKGKGGSSTMPHKRNPVGCAAVLSAGVKAPHLVATLFSGMVQEHERALGGWQAEWDVLPELAVITGGRHGNDCRHHVGVGSARRPDAAKLERYAGSDPGGSRHAGAGRAHGAPSCARVGREGVASGGFVKSALAGGSLARRRGNGLSVPCEARRTVEPAQLLRPVDRLCGCRSRQIPRAVERSGRGRRSTK